MCALKQPRFYSYAELPTCPITGLTYVLFSKLGYTEMANKRSISPCTSYSIFVLSNNLVLEPGYDSQYSDLLRAGRLEVRTHAWARNVLFPHTRPDWPCSPPSLLYNGYPTCFPGVKRPWRGVDYPCPHGADVKRK